MTASITYILKAW